MDQKIVKLLWKRKEEALEEMAAAYGQRLYGIAYNILGNRHDAEECVNDTYLALWNTIPPQRPDLYRGQHKLCCRLVRLY